VPSAMIFFGFDLIKPREGKPSVLDELVDTPRFHAFAPTTVAMRSWRCMTTSLWSSGVCRGSSPRYADIRRRFHGQLKQPPQGLEAEQQAARHLVGSRCGDYVLVRRQDVAQAAIERSLLVNRSTACRFVDELHRLDANSNGMRIKGGE